MFKTATMSPRADAYTANGQPIYFQAPPTQAPRKKKPRKTTRKKPAKCKQGFIFKCKNFIDNAFQGAFFFALFMLMMWIGETFHPFAFATQHLPQ